MTNALNQGWLYVLIPMFVTILGGVITTVRALGPQVRSALQHFTAGVVFAAVAGEVLPDVLHRQAPIPAVIGFALGVAMMFGMRRLTERAEAARSVSAALPLGLLAAVGVDAVLDGLVIGIGFSAGITLGLLVTIALSLEMFFLGLTTALTLRTTGASRMRVIAITSILALLIGAGAWLGLTVLYGLSDSALAGVLAFGCAALLYLVTEELLTEAHNVPETPLITSVFFLGFLVLMVIEMVI